VWHKIDPPAHNFPEVDRGICHRAAPVLVKLKHSVSRHSEDTKTWCFRSVAHVWIVPWVRQHDASQGPWALYITWAACSVVPELGAELLCLLGSLKPNERVTVSSQPHPQHPRGDHETRAEWTCNEDLQCVLRKGVAFGGADGVRDVLST